MSTYHFLTKEELEKEYSYNLTDQQFAILNQIEYEESRRKSQSIMRFLKKEIIKAGGSWSISFKNFCKDYNNWVNKRKKTRTELKNVSLTQFKFLINRLRDLNLISISVVDRKNVYKLVPTEKPTEEKPLKTVENASVKHGDNIPMLSGSNNIDIDSNSNSEKEFDSNRYEKCTSLVDVRNKVRELLKLKRVKNNWIKDKVLVAITKNYRNITVKFLESYILKAIKNARDAYYRSWDKYTRKYEKTVRQANFTQREYTEEEWKAIEDGLLGW